MALFGMGKKQEQAPPPAPPSGMGADVVVQEIQRMQGQGMGNSQIVQQLQRQGYKTYQIFDAFNTLDLAGKGGPIDQPVPPDPNMMQQPMSQDPYAGSMGAMQDPNAPPMMPPQYQQQYQQPQEQYQESLDQQPEEEERIEELVEAIVEEKWEELVKNVNKIIAWKNVMESRLSIIESRCNDLKSQFDDLNKGILEKMQEYDSNITNVGTEIKAMEQIFQKVLPTFTENINELSRLTKQMKQGQKTTPTLPQR